MKINRRLLRLARAGQPDLLLTVVLGLLAGILLAGQARLLSRAIGLAFAGGQGLDRVWPLLAALAGLALLRAGLTWAGEGAAQRAAARVKADVQTRLAAHLLALGPVYARGERTGELANTLVEGVEALDAYVRSYLPQAALALLVPVAYLALVFPLDWPSGLVLLLTAPLIPVFMVLIGNQAGVLTRRRWVALSRMSAHFLDVLQGLAALKLLGRSRDQVGIIARIGEQHRQATMGVLRVTFLSALVLELVAAVSTAVVAVEVSLRLLAGHLAFEQALFVLVLAPEFYLPLRQLGLRFHAGMAGVAAGERIVQVLDVEPAAAGLGSDEPDSGGAARTGLDVGQTGLGVRFEAVSYRYPGNERPAVEGVSFEIGPGEKVALVGPSGAGKSTLAALLLRFARPDAGGILVGGRPLGAIPPELWREQVAWVPQGPTLFYGSVADNIRLGRAGATDDDVARAARQAHADEFIRALPQGYATPLGERGARLSGGEAQRIALARAFLKGAPLVILDEATASLDPETAARVSVATEALLAERTALIIAHRLDTVRRADRIVVLDKGRVVDVGRHPDLLARGGLYAALVGAAEAAAESAPQLSESEAPAGPRPVLQDSAGKPAGPPLSRERPGPRPRNLPAARRLLAVARPLWPWMALAVILGLATIGSSVALMSTSAYLIARAAQQPPIAELSVAIVGVRFFGIARGLLRYAERLVSHEATFRLLARLRTWFYAALEPLAPARLMGYRSGDLLSRVVADVETLDNFYLRAIAPPLVAILVVGGAAAWMGRFSPRLVAVLVTFLLLAGLVVPLLTWQAGRRPGRDLLAARSALGSTVIEGTQGMAELLAFEQGGRHLEKVAAQRRRLSDLQARMARLSGLHQAATGLLAALATAGIVAAAIPLVRDGRLDGVYLGVLALAALAGFEAVAPLPHAFQYVENSLEAARRLNEVVDTSPSLPLGLIPPQPVTVSLSGTGASPDREEGSSLAGIGVKIEDVRFSYRPGEKPALDGVSFQVEPGQTVALVGPSGAGKTTVANLLVRFWDYAEGRILLRGRELRDVPSEDVRRQIAVVPQQPHLFNATIRDNLRLGRPAAGDDDLTAAARRAQIHDWIASLPEGYDTWIGEQGLRLSAGQRRRLAIARALVQDAPVLILDEPTANLDAIAGREVLAALLSAKSCRATLIIAHRLAGLETADEIVVLRGGRVVERGRHADLIARGGWYRRMWEIERDVLDEGVL